MHIIAIENLSPPRSPVWRVALMELLALNLKKWVKLLLFETYFRTSFDNLDLVTHIMESGIFNF